MNDISIAILTTETIHHSFFVKMIVEKYKNIKVFIDEKPLHAPFSIEHPYEAERDQFERESWFKDIRHYSIQNFSPCVSVNDINSTEAKKELFSYNADINIVFGTRKLSKEICEHFSGRLVNLHGGDPQRYRGLDSHLWALYHQDKVGLVTALHEVNAHLDDGNLIEIAQLDFSHIFRLAHIRKENTEVCVKLVKNFLSSFAQNNTINSFKQNKVGRYYSFMPSILKEVINKNFSNGTYEKIFR